MFYSKVYLSEIISLLFHYFNKNLLNTVNGYVIIFLLKAKNVNTSDKRNIIHFCLFL